MEQERAKKLRKQVIILMVLFVVLIVIMVLLFLFNNNQPEENIGVIHAQSNQIVITDGNQTGNGNAEGNQATGSSANINFLDWLFFAITGFIIWIVLFKHGRLI